MGICYLVGAGDFPYPFSPSGDDFVIAADGGFDSLKSHGIRCDLLIGDLDSIESSDVSGIETIRFPVRKDMTDMHLAYLQGKARGYDTFYIYGGTGGREDHTFANYSLLLYIRNHGGRATLFSENAEITLIKNESITLQGKAGKTLSLFAFGGCAQKLTVKGAEYECEDILLTSDFPLCVSNSFRDLPVTVSVGEGTLLIMKEL